MKNNYFESFTWSYPEDENPFYAIRHFAIKPMRAMSGLLQEQIAALRDQQNVEEDNKTFEILWFLSRELKLYAYGTNEAMKRLDEQAKEAATKIKKAESDQLESKDFSYDLPGSQKIWKRLTRRFIRNP